MCMLGLQKSDQNLTLNFLLVALYWYVFYAYKQLCRLDGETFSISLTLAVGFFEDLKPEGDIIITEIIMTSPEDSNLRRNLLRVSNWLRKRLKCDLPHHY